MHRRARPSAAAAFARLLGVVRLEEPRPPRRRREAPRRRLAAAAERRHVRWASSSPLEPSWAAHLSRRVVPPKGLVAQFIVEFGAGAEVADRLAPAGGLLRPGRRDAGDAARSPRPPRRRRRPAPPRPCPWRRRPPASPAACSDRSRRSRAGPSRLRRRRGVGRRRPPGPAASSSTKASSIEPRSIAAPVAVSAPSARRRTLATPRCRGCSARAAPVGPA